MGKYALSCGEFGVVLEVMFVKSLAIMNFVDCFLLGFDEYNKDYLYE